MLSPICNNHLFPAAKLNATDIQWDTFIDNIFPTFADFAKKTLITKPSFLRYLQNRHFIQTYNQSFPQLPERSNLGVILKTPLSLKGQISNLYNSIMLFISCVNITSSCVRLNLIQFKVRHRTHYSKVRLAKIYPELDETCDRCRATKADLAHMLWSRSKLGEFSMSIFERGFWPRSTT